MTDPETIFEIADDLDREAAKLDKKSLKKLEEACLRAAKSFCGSWLGYHSRIYYGNLDPVPPGARFSVEWGLGERMLNETTGRWSGKLDFDAVIKRIDEWAGNPAKKKLGEGAEKAAGVFEEAQAKILSALSQYRTKHPDDSFLAQLMVEIEKDKLLGLSDFLRGFRGNQKVFTRDSLAGAAGFQTPAHFHILAEIGTWRQPFSLCAKLAKQARRAASHFESLEKRAARATRIGTHVFIGHGRSPVWKEFRDFIRDRVKLPWDEFNRVPVAGVTNVNRLMEMLDTAAIAFLIMTAEDEQPDGRQRARMNVIHEVGLFQGRLGFTRAIILIEEGCEEFSNVHGLGHVSFPRSDISKAFEEVRRILEREELIAPPE